MATMNLGDPELELIDPTPNVHQLFLQFDKIFFWMKLASRVVVRWSKRMYSCAGICSYEGRGGLCDIALSEPLLRLRPRKDLVETLLHEMIHAYLFVASRDQDRDGHGPNFKAHMKRINQAAGLNITIYHDFHDEVELYQTHWWRCDGRCQKIRPHFGVVRRAFNRAPGPQDYWWRDHQRKCGGTFIKIREPINPKKRRKLEDQNQKVVKPVNNGDITKFIKPVKTPGDNTKSVKPVLKDSNTNAGVFTGAGQSLISNSNKRTFDARNVTEHVRNVWSNKVIPTAINKEPAKKPLPVNPNKNKSETVGIKTPPPKTKKINDYFTKTNAASMLKDLYGEDFELTQSDKSMKWAVSVKEELVDCPVCHAKVSSEGINRHLDECLNKDIIKNLTQENPVQEPPQQNAVDTNTLRKIVGVVQEIPPYQGRQDNTSVVDITNLPNKANISRDTNNIVTSRKSLNDSEPSDKKIVPGIKRPYDSTSTTNVDNPKKILITPATGYKKLVAPVKRPYDPATTELERVFDKINGPTLSEGTSRDVNNEYYIPAAKNTRKSDSFVTTSRGDEALVKKESNKVVKSDGVIQVKVENTGRQSPTPSTSSAGDLVEQTCPCCGRVFGQSMEEHLDECLGLYDNDKTIPTIVIDDDEDMFDESLSLNATGTKTPCPCCMQMIEQDDMNTHLDYCLGIK